MAESYQSEITKFLQELKESRPGLEARQRAGRALLWDRRIDLEEQEAFRQATVPQKPYVYQTE